MKRMIMIAAMVACAKPAILARGVEMKLGGAWLPSTVMAVVVTVV